MNKRSTLKITSIVLLITIISSIKEYDYTPNITYIDGEDCFASYSNGYVYIGSEEYIKKIKDSVNENDILVIDERCEIDPNFCICESYKITSRQQREEIIDILLEYEKLYPSEWNRTKESMKNEWQIHNLLFVINYKLDHTTDVDLNNEDELLYNSKILTKILVN